MHMIGPHVDGANQPTAHFTSLEDSVFYRRPPRRIEINRSMFKRARVMPLPLLIVQDEWCAVLIVRYAAATVDQVELFDHRPLVDQNVKQTFARLGKFNFGEP